MKVWNVVGKYPVVNEDGKISHTEITIVSTAGGYATYTERVAGDHLAKSEAELIKLAREAYFKDEYADRAMAESVQKIDEMEIAIRESKKLNEELQDNLVSATAKVEQMDKALERSEQQFIKMENLMKVTAGTVNEIIATLMVGADEDEETTEQN